MVVQLPVQSMVAAPAGMHKIRSRLDRHSRERGNPVSGSDLQATTCEMKLGT